MIAFGPVPSRRLGRSLGINNIPPKICTYSCIYCQLGRTIKMQGRRGIFYEPEQVLQDVHGKVGKAGEAGETIDYLAFVPDGEPTLDVNLGREIDLLRPLGIKIAVITNSSFTWREDVRGALLKADWVSLKMDSVREEVWRRINRPHGSLRLTSILDGALEFAQAFKGELATETMLVEGINDDAGHLEQVAGFLARLQLDTAYLSIPIRPPAEEWARPPDEGIVNRAYQILSGRHGRVEYLIGYEGNAFAFTGDVEEDLLSITAVHPMRKDAVIAFLARAGTDGQALDQLLGEGQLVAAEYGDHVFYLRRLRTSITDTTHGQGSETGE